MTIFDRSWYGRVLVERVENLATEVQWRRAYQEINDFEHTLAEEGMIVIKLWMHMSHEEQLRRFERRRDDPLKSWKLTAEDWRNREKRAEYDQAVSDMLRLTNGPLALGRHLVGEQTPRTGGCDRDGHPTHGGGHGALGRLRPLNDEAEEKTSSPSCSTTRSSSTVRAGHCRGPSQLTERRPQPKASANQPQPQSRCGKGQWVRRCGRADAGVARPEPRDQESRSPSTDSAPRAPWWFARIRDTATPTSGRPKWTAPTASPRSRSPRPGSPR